MELHYLRLLSRNYPTIIDASTEIINLQAILNLPKGTEHFLADIHGEHEAFLHVLKNASGNIKRKVTELFGRMMRESEMQDLCTLIYYPEQKLEVTKAQEPNLHDWYQTTLHRLVLVCREVSSKYTRSKVRKSLPPEFSYIIEELLHERTDDIDKSDYVRVIVDTIISIRRADDFICAICHVIQRLSIDQLHLLGDIFDRGPGAHIIMDHLRRFHSWDIQWGNHDVLWMGAAAGNEACICNVIRLSLRYGNLAVLEEGYGINLVPLATFAMETYADDPCTAFIPKESTDLDEKTDRLTTQMHKAITILQFKLEAQLYDRHPEWHMQDRKLLSQVDFQRHVCTIDGKEHQMKTCRFPTVDPQDPNRLTQDEQYLIDRLRHSFLISEKLQKHVKTLLSHGCMYAVYNSNLLFHASVPLNQDGTLKQVELMGEQLCGKDLMHSIGMLIRNAFAQDAPSQVRSYARDYFLYLWCGPDSPLFDKSKMATFERYFLTDKDTFHEEKGWYYKLRDDASICDRILDAFDIHGKHRHIINGHVPVHASRGESPIKADGRLMVIDGGFSKAYHSTTGIAGYTLVYHSRGFQLVQHEPFTSADDAIRNGTDIVSTRQIVELSGHRLLVSDTDKGNDLRSQIEDLKQLVYAYRHGIIKEKRV